MKKGFVFFIAYSLIASVNAAENLAIGFWKTIDDVTGKPKAIVQISENHDKTLSGRIIKIYPRRGYDQNELCEACSGIKHNQRIVGMEFLEKLTQDPEHHERWSNGTILDPHNGKLYSASLRVMDHGNKLYVRGYVGLPLLGRTQIWEKVENPAV